MSSKQTILAAGRDVIRLEADSLQALEHSLGDDFTQAVTTIYNAKQHVVVVGMGKSGHIGRKLAASFASTGTPSFFIHPSEAAHGDLGMITPGSVIIGLSNSGQSAEVNRVIEYARSLSNQTIAITSASESTLAKSADIALILPSVKEACPNGLAPTTTTTLMLALGDALCVAVMKLSGFSVEEFGERHPAGKLGFGLRRVGDYLKSQDSPPPLISLNTSMADIILAMTQGGKGCVGVADEGDLRGIITDGDLRRAMGPDIMSKTAAEIMSANPYTLRTDMRMKDVISAFTDRSIGNAFVIDDQKIIGLIDLKTLLATGYS